MRRNIKLLLNSLGAIPPTSAAPERAGHDSAIAVLTVFLKMILGKCFILIISVSAFLEYCLFSCLKLLHNRTYLLIPSFLYVYCLIINDTGVVSYIRRFLVQLN